MKGIRSSIFELKRKAVLWAALSFFISISAQAAPGSIAISSGNSQSSAYGTALPVSLVALVKDTNGKALSGATVKWSVTSGAGTLSSTSTTSSSTGLATVTFTPAYGTNTVHALVNGTSYAVDFTETGSAGPATQIAIVSGTNQTGTVLALLPAPLIVIAKDAAGHPAPNTSIKWVVTVGGGQMSTSLNKSDVLGQASITYTSGTVPGLNMVSATIQGTSVTTTFTETAATGTNRQIVILSGDAQAPGAAGAMLANPLVVRVLDLAGNVVSGAKVDWAVVSGGGTVSAAQTTSDSLGKAQINFTTGGGGGRNVVSATIHGATPYVSFTEIANVTNIDHIAFTTDLTGLTFNAGIAFTTQPAVTLYDASNVIVSGINAGTMTMTISSGSLTAGATSNTISHGVANFATLTTQTVGTGFTVTASFTYNGHTYTANSGAFNVNPGVFNSLVYTTPPTTPVTTDATNTIVAKEYDAYGNLLTTDSASSMTLTAYTTTNCTTTTVGSALSVPSASTSGGIGTFASEQIYKTTVHSILASSTVGGITKTACSGAITVNPGALNSLTYTTPPTTPVTTDQTDTVAVTAYDTNGNVLSTDTSAITLTAYSTTNCSTSTVSSALSATSVNASAGVSTFTNLQTYKTTVQSILASSTVGGVTKTVCSGAIVVNPGALNSLAYTTPLPNPTTTDATNTIALTAYDVNNNALSTDTSAITLTAYSTTNCATTTVSSALSATSVNASAGVGTFSNLQVYKTTVHSILASTTVGGVTKTACASSLTINPGALNSITFSTPITTPTTTDAMHTAAVTAWDANNNALSTDSSAITLAAYSTTDCTSSTVSSALSSTSVNASSGVSTFTNLQIYKTSVQSVLASTTVGGVTKTVCSGAIVVNVGALNSIAFTTPPTSPVTTDATHTVAVTAYDANNNVLTTDASAITLTGYSTTNCATTTVSSSLSSTSVNASSGVSTFTNLQIYKTSVQSILASTTVGGVTKTVCASSLTVNPGAAASLAFTTDPGTGAPTYTAGTVIGTQPVVKVYDANNNLKTDYSGSISLTADTSASCGAPADIASGLSATTNPIVLSGSSTATFAGVTILKTNAVKLRATDGTLQVCSSAFTVNPSGLNSIVFTTPPTSPTTTDSTNTVAVTAYDVNNNVLSTDTSAVTLTAYSTTNCSTTTVASSLSATSVNASAGVGTFSNLQIYKTSVQSILASTTVGGVTRTVCAASLTINPGALNSLTYSTPPTTPTTTDATNTIAVTAWDVNNNVITTDTSAVTLTAYSTNNCTTSTVASALSATSVNAALGVGTFAALQIYKTSVQSILASSTVGGVTKTVCSAALTVNGGALNSLAFTTAPTTPATTDATNTVVVKAYDVNNNVLNTDTSAITLAGYSSIDCTSSTVASSLSSTSINAVAGVSTFTNLQIYKTSVQSILASSTVGGVTKTVCAGSLSVTPGAFSIANSTFVSTSQSVVSSAGGTTITASITPLDAHGNASPTGTPASITFTQAASASGGTINNTFPITATLSGGLYSANISGNHTGTVTLQGTVSAVNSTSQDVVTITAGAASKLAFTTSPAGGSVDTALGNLTVQAQDVNGNPVASTATVAITLNSSSSCAAPGIQSSPNGTAGLVVSGSAPPATALSGTPGLVTFSTVSATKVGSLYVCATDNAVVLTSAYFPVTMTVGAFSITKSTFVATSQSVAASAGGTTITTSMTPLDQYGNASPTGTPASITYTKVSAASGGAVNNTFPVTATLASGLFSATFSGNTTGTVTIQGTSSAVNSTSQDVITITSGALTHFTVTGSATAYTGSAQTYTVTALDVNNNAVTNFTDSTAITTPGDATATKTPASITSWTNGVGTVSVNFDNVGTWPVTATDGAVTANISVVVTAPPIYIGLTDANGNARTGYSILAQACSAGQVAAPTLGCVSTSSMVPVGSPIYISRYATVNGVPGTAYTTGSNTVTVTLTPVTALAPTQFSPSASNAIPPVVAAGSGSPTTTGYTASGGVYTTTLTIPSGVSGVYLDTASFGVAVNATVTGDTYFTVALSSPSGGAVLGGSSLAQVSLIDKNYTIAAGYGGGGDITFSDSLYKSSLNTVTLTMHRSFNTTVDETVDVELFDGTGKCNTDYSPFTGSNCATNAQNGAIALVKTVTFCGTVTTACGGGATPNQEITFTVPVTPSSTGVNTSFFAQIVPHAFTGNTTAGSTTVASVSSTTGLAVGNIITGVGIISGTTISAISGSNITLSTAANTTASSVKLMTGYGRSQSIAKILVMSTGEPTFCDSTAVATVTGTGTVGSNVITGVSSTAGLALGQLIASTSTVTRIAANSYITAFTANSITINNNITGTTGSFTITTHPFGGFLLGTSYANVVSNAATAGSASNPYLVCNNTQFANMASTTLCGNGSTSCSVQTNNFQLVNDLTATAPITANMNANFNGNEHIVYNYSSPVNGNAIFNSINPTTAASTIQKFNLLYGSSITATAGGALLIGSNGATGSGYGAKLIDLFASGYVYSNTGSAYQTSILEQYKNVSANAQDISTQYGMAAGLLNDNQNVGGAGPILGQTGWIATSSLSATVDVKNSFSTANVLMNLGGNAGGVIGAPGDYGAVTNVGGGHYDYLTSTGYIKTVGLGGGIIGIIAQDKTSVTPVTITASHNSFYGSLTMGSGTNALGGIVGNIYCGNGSGTGYCNYTTFTLDQNINYGTLSSGTAARMGGVLGYYSLNTNSASPTNIALNITNNISYGTVTATTNTSAMSGGLIGIIAFTDSTNSVNNSMTISGNTAVGNVNYNSNTTGANYWGGFVGIVQANYLTSSSITNNHATGNVACGGVAICGGFAGSIQSPGSIANYIPVSNSSATGNVTGVTANTAGFVGYPSYENFTNCYATGSVTTGGNYAGGFAGEAATVTFTNCYATGNISTTANVSYIGGFAGYPVPATFVKCYATGNITDSGHVSTIAGGFIGYGASTITASQCWSTGSVSINGDYAAGFIGQVAANSTVSQCYSAGATATASAHAAGFTTIISAATLTANQSYTITSPSATNKYGFAYLSAGGAVTSSNSYWLANNGVTDTLPGIPYTQLTHAVGATYSGTYSSAAATITGLSSTTGLAPGQLISGTNIPANTTITSVGSNWVALSATPTGSGTSFSNDIYNYAGWDTDFTTSNYWYELGSCASSQLSPTGGCPTASYPFPTLIYPSSATSARIYISSAPTITTGNMNSYTVSGTCNVNGNTVTVYVDGSSVGTAVCATGSSPQFSITFNASTLTDGTHTIMASMPDGSSNIMTNSVAVIDNTVIPPAPTAIALNTPASSPGSNASPVLTVTLSAFTAGNTVSLYTNSSCAAPSYKGTATASGTSVNVTVSPALAAIGPQTYYAQTANAYGNISACSSAHVTYDYETPIMQFTDVNGNIRTGFSVIASICSTSPTGCASNVDYGVPVGSPIYISLLNAGALYNSSGATSVTVTYTGISAVTGTQLTNGSYTATIPNGASSVVVDSHNFVIGHSATVTADTYFVITLSAPNNGAVLATAPQAQVNIVDPNYVTPTYGGGGDVMFSHSFYSTTAGGSTATLYLQRPFNQSTTEPVDVKFFDGTGAAGTDYTGTTQTVTFTSGTTKQEIAVTVPVTTGTNGVNKSFFAQIVPHAFTGTITAGSTSVTSVSSTTGLAVGQTITGVGIINGTTISAISGSTLTLSAAANYSVTSQNLTVGSARSQSIAKIRILSSGEACDSAAPGTITANTTVGSNIITVSSASGLAIGQILAGANIAGNTVITAISGTTLTLNNAATGTGTGVTLNTHVFGGFFTGSATNGGSSSNPYLVCNTGQWTNMGSSTSYCNGSTCNTAGNNFMLAADFTPSAVPAAISTMSANLDGNEHIIYDYASVASVPLFATVNPSGGGTTLQKINMLYASVTGTLANSAAFIGVNGGASNYQAILTDDFVSGYVKTTTGNADALLVAQMLGTTNQTSATIQYGMVSGLVSATTALYVGGLVGEYKWGNSANGALSTLDLRNSFTTANVITTGGEVGGAVGYILDSLASSYFMGNQTLTAIQSTGYVSGYTYVGGILGAFSTEKATTVPYTFTLSYSNFSGSALIPSTGTHYVGGIVGGIYCGGAGFGAGLCEYMTVTVDHDVNSGTVTDSASGGLGAAGIVSSISHASTAGETSYFVNVTNSTNMGNVAATTGTTGYMGGVLGYVYFGMGSGAIPDGASFTGNINSGNVTAGVAGSGGVGGVIGYIQTRTPTVYTVTGNYSTGNINCGTAPYCAGFVGQLYPFSGTASYSNDFETGNVTAGGNYSGGFVGWNAGNAANSIAISNSYATGNVTGTANASYLGGFVGYNQDANETNCFASGNVTDTHATTSVGGFAGITTVSTMSQCWSTGNVSTTGTYAGGFVGYVSPTSTFNQCYSAGNTASAATDAAGFAGFVGSTSTYNQCYTITLPTTATTKSGFMVYSAGTITANQNYWLAQSGLTDTYAQSVTAQQLSYGVGTSYSGTVTSGSPNITGVSSTAGLAVGQGINGTGIPATATISAIYGSTVVMSANATGSGVSFSNNIYSAYAGWDSAFETTNYWYEIGNCGTSQLSPAGGCPTVTYPYPTLIYPSSATSARVYVTVPAASGTINGAANTHTFTVSGLCNINGQQVSVFVDGSAALSPVGGVCNGTTFSMTIDLLGMGLSDGSHTFSATMNDGSSRTIASVPVTETLAAVTPATPTAVTLTTPVSSPGSSATPTFTVTLPVFNAGDSVAIYANNTCGMPAFKGSLTATGTSVPVVVTTTLSATGPQRYYAQTTSARGTVSACSSVYATYDYEVPTLQFTDVLGNVRNDFSVIASQCSLSPTGCASNVDYGVPVGSPIYVSLLNNGSLYNSSGATTVTVSYTGISAVTGTQLTNGSYTASIPNGSSSVVVDSHNFVIGHSATVTADTYFVVTLSVPGNGAVLPPVPQAQVNIVDPNYVTPTYGGGGHVMFSHSFYSTTPGASTATLYLQRPFNQSNTEPVDVIFFDGTGTAGTDYTSTLQTVTFTSGTTNQEIAVSVPVSASNAGINKSFFAQIVPHSFTGNITAGSTSVTSVSSTAGLAVGQTITGIGIINGTTISAISGSTLTLSAAANNNTTGLTMIVGSARTQSIAKVRIMSSLGSEPVCDTTAPGTITGDTVAGRYTITNASSTTGLAVGQIIVGTYLPGNTLITAINGSTITLNGPAAETQTTATFNTHVLGGFLTGSSTNAGTQANPYLVCNTGQWSNMTNATYCNGTSCNLSTNYFQLGADFTPTSIPTALSTLNSNLDGNEHIIYGYTSATGVPLITTVNPANQGTTIQKVNMLYASVTGTASNTAAFIGTNGGAGNYQAKLTDDFVSGYVKTTTGTANGLLVGQVLGTTNQTDATIQYAMTSGLVSATTGTYTGGIVGQYKWGNSANGALATQDLKNSFCAANVITTAADVGGAVGWMTDSGLTPFYAGNQSFTSIVATGLVQGYSYVGGIMGYVQSYKMTSLAYTGTLSYNKFYGSVLIPSGGTYYAGGILGGFYGGLSSVYWVTYYTLTLDHNTNYGTVTDNATAGSNAAGIVGSLTGNQWTGTTNNFYTVTNNTNYGNVAATTGANTNLGGILGYTYAGMSSLAVPSGITLTGNANGGNVTAGTTASTGAHGGIAGYLYIRTPTVASISSNYSTGNITGGGGTNVGGNVGYLYVLSGSASITSSYATGNVTGGGVGLGGFMGYNYGGTLSGDYATGNVTTTATITSVGGFAGTSGTITKCYSTGNVSDTFSSSIVGGFAGSVTGPISQSWESGSVSGSGGSVYTSCIGGFIGKDDGQTVSQNYAAGASVTGGTYVGGFYGCAWNDATSTINYNYTLATSTGQGFGYNSVTSPTSNNNYWLVNGAITDAYVTYTTCDANVTGANAHGSRCTAAQLKDSTNANWNFAGWDYSGGTRFNGSVWVAPTGGTACGTPGVNVCPSANYAYPTLRQ